MYTDLATTDTSPNNQARDQLRSLGRLLLLAVTYLRPGLPIEYVPPVSAGRPPRRDHRSNPTRRPTSHLDA